MIKQQKFRYLLVIRECISIALLLILTSCAGRTASVPDMTILTEIQATLEAAAAVTSEQPDSLTEVDSDLLAELMPSLSLDQSLLTPVEPRHSITSPNLPADVFFNVLVAETKYGVAISEDVDVNINVSLPNVTVEEAMDMVAELYNLDITRRGNIFTIRPGGLRTRQFTIDYLNIQRSGSSSIQVSSQGGGNNNANNQFGGGNFGGGNFGGGNFGGGNFGGGAFSNNSRNFGGLGGGNQGIGGIGAGGTISTSTSTDFWTDLEAAISNLIGEESGSGSSTPAPVSTGLGQFGGIGGGGARNQINLTDEGKRVFVQPLTGIIIVTAYPHELDLVEEFIEEAQERLHREVIIQVQFLEVILNKGFQYAIDFNTFGLQANNPVTGSGAFNGTSEGLLGSDNDQAGEFLAADFGIEGISNPLQLSTAFSDFDAVFQLLETRGTTSVVSSSQLRVLNNQPAIFQAGDDEFFQTQAGSTTVASTTSTTTSEDNSLQQFFAGISMEITPQISADGIITLHIHPVVTAVDEQLKNIGDRVVPLARTTTREIDTIIRAKDGEIVVLGGLTFERTIDETAGIPGINRVPVLGSVLEQKQRQLVKSEFIILLKPIIASKKGNRDVLNESRERFQAINRLLDPFANN